MPDRQAAKPDEQVVDQDPPDDGPAILFVQPRQETVNHETRAHRIGHGKQGHEGGNEHKSETFFQHRI